MKLEEYLKAIKECHDEMVDIIFCNKLLNTPKLAAEFGVHDNFSIFLNADFHGLCKYFKNHNKFSYIGTNNQKQTKFYYTPGIVTLAFEETDIHRHVFGNYVASIFLYPSIYNTETEIKVTRAYANVIEDIGRIILNENIPVTMLCTKGLKYADEEHSSRIVKHEPVGPIVSEYLRIIV